MLKTNPSWWIKGCAFQNWKIKNISNTSVTFILDEPDGHMGFPGNIHLKSVMKLMIAQLTNNNTSSC